MGLRAMREDFWWILAFLALAAALLFGAAGHSPRESGGPGAQNSGPAEPWSGRPRPPFQY